MYSFNYTLPFENKTRVNRTLYVYRDDDKGVRYLERIVNIRIPRELPILPPISPADFHFYRSKPRDWQRRGVTGVKAQVQISTGLRQAQHKQRMHRDYVRGIWRSQGVFNPDAAQMAAFS